MLRLALIVRGERQVWQKSHVFLRFDRERRKRQDSDISTSSLRSITSKKRKRKRFAESDLGPTLVNPTYVMLSRGRHITTSYPCVCIYRYLAPRFCVVCPFCLFFRYVSRKSKVALKKSLFVWRLAISFNKSRNMKNVLLSVSVVSVASCDTRRLFTEYLYVYLVFSTILLRLLPHQVLLL